MQDVHRQFWGAFIALLAVVAIAACGGDESGEGKPPKPAGSVGEANRSTNERADAVAPGATKRPDGTLEGEPSLDDLDRTELPEGAVGAPGRSCSGGGLAPQPAVLSQVRATTLCLLNAERRARGLSRLRSNGRLARSALGHARDMVRRGYFAHVARSGASVIDRIRRGGYLTGARRWTVGENLAWGSGARATPREIVDAWMRSPGHRANILAGQFREVGIGIALGAPRRGVRSAATYNTNFGARRG
jgi:uncharacterized protein YkwD